MSALSITYTFIPGNVIKASEHNQNMNDITSWANGNIDDTNFGTMTGPVNWAVTTNSLAINITNNGTQGSIAVAHNATLASAKSAVVISSNSAQSAGNALLEVKSTSASSAIPAVLINDAGVGGAALKVVSTTKPSHSAPSMTTTQRNAMTGVSAGDEIYNTTIGRKEIYNGTNWVSSSGASTGQIIDFAGSSVPTYALACDGSAVSRTTYAALFAILGTTWGAGDTTTTFNLPDLRRKVTVGSGGSGSGTLANTVGSSGGEESHVLITAELAAHTHMVTGSADNVPDHNHSGSTGSTDPVLTIDLGSTPRATFGGTNSVIEATTTYGAGSDYQRTGANHLHSIGNDGAHFHTLTATAQSTGSGTAHNNLQPSAVVTKCVVI